MVAFFQQYFIHFEVFFPTEPIQTFFKRPVIKARLSNYYWALIGAIQQLKKGVRMKGEGAKFNET